MMEQDRMKVSKLEPNIRDLDRFRDSLWDWCFLNGCFGKTKIRVSDIDGIVERNGQVLVIEGKPMGFVPDFGQEQLWRGLAGRGIWVLVLWGEALDMSKPTLKAPIYASRWKPGELERSEKKLVSVEGVRRFVQRWFEWADRGQFDLDGGGLTS